MLFFTLVLHDDSVPSVSHAPISIETPLVTAGCDVILAQSSIQSVSPSSRFQSRFPNFSDVFLDTHQRLVAVL